MNEEKEKRIDEVVEDILCYNYWFSELIEHCVREEVETWSDDQLREFRAEPPEGMLGITSVSINRDGVLQELPVIVRETRMWEGSIPPGTLVMTPKR